MADANKTLDDLTDDEFAELEAAGRISEDGDILPADGEDAGSEDDQDIDGSDEGDKGDIDAKSEDDAEGDDKAKADPDPAPAKTEDKADGIDGGDTGQDKEDVDGEQQHQIPKARLDQEAERRRKAEEALDLAQRKLAFMEGRDSVRSSDSKSEADAAQKNDQKSVQQLETEIDEVWEQAESGDLTLSQARKLEREKQTEIDGLKQSSEKQKAPDPNIDEVHDFIEDQATQHANAVLSAHPYLGIMSESDQSILRVKVDEKIKSEGIALPKGKIARTNRILDLMGQLSDTLGPALTGKTLAPKTAPDPELTPEQIKQAAAAKADERRKKMDVASRQPPNSNATGAAEGGVGEYTDDQIANMSETELEALPPAVLERMANS